MGKIVQNTEEYAGTPASKSVFFDDTNTNLNVDDMQGAIEALNSKIASSGEDVLADAKEYTDTKVASELAALVDGAPETMNTLKEISDALANNKNVVEALEDAIATKANATDLDNYLPKTGGEVNGDVTVTGTLTAGKIVGMFGAISDIQIVDELPADANDHPTTLYIVTS